jgi:hypothetical protein
MCSYEEYFAYVLQHGLFGNAEHRQRLEQLSAQIHDISAASPALFKAACQKLRYTWHCGAICNCGV